jgi:hypothetical protein
MKAKQFVPRLSIAALIVCMTVSNVEAADSANWTGEYADKTFLNGQAIFQLSISQDGAAMKVSFDAVYNDGHGCAPEAEGPAKITGKGTLAFKFKDSSHNAGTGTITRAGDDVIVSLKATRVADLRCVVFYRENMRLVRQGKR